MRQAKKNDFPKDVERTLAKILIRLRKRWAHMSECTLSDVVAPTENIKLGICC